MKIQRTIPPAAAPIGLKNLLYGLAGIFFGKEYLKRLEDEMKEHFGVKHVFLVSSGKAALTLILQALKSLAPEKKEVLIPAYTCYSVPSSIVKADLKIYLCDINPATFDFDYKLLEESINENTLCVIPTHLFGIPSDMDRINNLCRDRGVFVIEDAAQAMGVKFNGKLLGTLGDIGFFSLGRGKNITCGSGGIIITNSDQIALAISKQYSNLQYPSTIESVKDLLKIMLMAIFIHPSLYWFPSGLPFLKLGETIFYKEFPIKRLSGMKAGILRNWQNKLEESNRIHRENAEYFCSAPSKIIPSPVEGEGQGEGEFLGSDRSPDLITYLRLPFILDSKEERDRINSILYRWRLGLRPMYPTPINEIEEIRDQFNGRTFSSASEVAERLLTIPTHQLLKKKDREDICKLFNVGYEAFGNACLHKDLLQ
jgi:dTDP-4-amino-4,6-dideoxygalactose transaminase